jgi:lysophospholipase L1-like esterase
VKGRLKNLLAFITGVLIAGILAEGFVRLVFPQQDIAEWFTAHDTYGFAMKPNYHQRYAFASHDFMMDVQTNSLGFRDAEHDLTQPFGGKTILVAGDSFAFGYAVNAADRFDTKLGVLFQDDNVRTINTAVPGWGTRNETAYAKTLFDCADPDIIVLTFCGNDPANDRGLESPTLPNEVSLFYQPKAFLRRNSHVYRLVLKQLSIEKQRRSRDHHLRANPDAHVDTQSARIVTKDDWNLSLTLIRSFHEEYLRANPQGNLIVLATDPDAIPIQRQLSSLAQTERLHFLDWSEAASPFSPEDRRLPWDGHWSPQVHDVVAQALHNLIEDKGLLSAD